MFIGLKIGDGVTPWNLLPGFTSSGVGPQGPTGYTGASSTVTLTDGNTSVSYYNSSVNFAPGEKLNVYFQTNSSAINDVSIQLDCF